MAIVSAPTLDTFCNEAQSSATATHCQWSSDTLRFMTQLHEEACGLRVDIVKATFELASNRTENTKLKEDNERLMRENGFLKQQIERMHEAMSGIQNDQQRRIWNFERENSANTETLKSFLKN